MRIVGGKHRGRNLKGPEGKGVRPTSDRAREGVFNILAHSIDWPGFDEASVLDVFCGTGAFGLECLSRGADHATFIDNSSRVLKIVRENAGHLDEGAHITPLRIDVNNLPSPPLAARPPADLTFLDAPYGLSMSEGTLQQLHDKGWLAPDSVVVVETEAAAELVLPQGFLELKVKTYGAAKMFFLSHQ